MGNNATTHLPLNIETFSFVQREKCDGVTVKYKCGRDFLYYALHYYVPTEFNAKLNNPQEIDKKRLFGRSLPTWLAWTQLQFYTMPAFLKLHLLELTINDVKITSYFKMVFVMLFSRISFEQALKKIEENIREGKAAGVDIALRFQGLEDHVLFVYGYDQDNLFVFDTNQVPRLAYEKLTHDDRFYMKLPKAEVKRRWKMFSRVWEVCKVSSNHS